MSSVDKSKYEGIRARINERLEAMSLSARKASIDAGGSPDLIRNINRNNGAAPRADTLEKLAKVLQVSVDWLISGKGEVVFVDNVKTLPTKLRVPLISWVSAGTMAFPDVTEETIGTVEETGLDPQGDWIALRVVGDSMDRISPPDSIIFIDRSDKVLVPNACYVISNGDGEATYKRFRPNPMRFEPVSTNAAHETIYPQREPLIVGRVKKSVIDM